MDLIQQPREQHKIVVHKNSVKDEAAVLETEDTPNSRELHTPCFKNYKFQIETSSVVKSFERQTNEPINKENKTSNDVNSQYGQQQSMAH